MFKDVWAFLSEVDRYLLQYVFWALFIFAGSLYLFSSLNNKEYRKFKTLVAECDDVGYFQNKHTRIYCRVDDFNFDLVVVVNNGTESFVMNPDAANIIPHDANSMELDDPFPTKFFEEVLE